jgi:hypothetical protein
MTWGRALPVIAVSFVFDALRSFFGMFWLFGPALAAAYCDTALSDTLATWTFGLLGAKTAATACAAGATVAGSLLSAPLIIFGTVMGMAIGLFGWLTVGLVLMMTNSRIFTEHAGHSLMAIIGLGVSELPLIGALPALTGTTWKMYHSQIKADKEAMEKYEKKNAATNLQERRQQAAELMQIQESRLDQVQQQNAAQEEMYGEEQEDSESEDEQTNVIRFPSERTYGSAVRKQNIPDELREAA